MKILTYPNKSLETPTELVSSFDSELEILLDNMKTAMTKANGIGLSANQVGVNKSIFLVKDKNNVVHEFINPKILETEGSAVLNEGCLSAPGIHLAIARPTTVLVEYQDKSGEKKKMLCEGIEARAVLHEMEHLQGDFYFNRVNRQVRKAAQAQLRRHVGNRN